MRLKPALGLTALAALTMAVLSARGAQEKGKAPAAKPAAKAVAKKGSSQKTENKAR